MMLPLIKNLTVRLAYKIFIFLAATVLTSCGSPAQLNPLPPHAVILSFGDSLTYGTGASADNSYPTDLAKITGFKVINSGIPGEETAQGLAHIDQDLSTYQPQLVILCLGGNDFLHGVPREKVKDNLAQIIQKIQKAGVQLVMIGVPEPSLSLRVPELYGELSQEYNVPLDKDILLTLLQTPEYKSDYIHLNAQGYKMMAADVASFLKNAGAIPS